MLLDSGSKPITKGPTVAGLLVSKSSQKTNTLTRLILLQEGRDILGNNQLLWPYKRPVKGQTNKEENNQQRKTNEFKYFFYVEKLSFFFVYMYTRVMDQCTFFFLHKYIYESGELPDPTFLGLATC